MADYSSAAVTDPPRSHAARLEPDAIGVAQDTVIGMASSAPAATVGLSVAALAVATAYGSGLILILTAIPMLIIANSYRRLNLWNANCGASFEWVGRAINPYLGFLTGWLMVAAYIIGTVAEVLLLGSSSTNTTAYVLIGVIMVLIMLVIAVVGIRITARVQVSMAAVEYLILIGLAIAGLIYVAAGHRGVVHFSTAWLSPSGIGGKGSAVAGFLVAVFVYGGWDGTLYVNEEVKHRRVNPGRAAMWAVGLLAILYTLAQVGFQGVLSPAALAKSAANGTALIDVANALGGGFWAKVMALSIALSVVATTGTGIVLTSRIVYGMASYRVLPQFLANVSRRFATPVAASIIVGVLIAGLSTIYFVATSVQNAFTDVIDVTGLLFSIFYILTAVTLIVYYRRRLTANVWDAVALGVLPLAAAAFLGWILVKSLLAAPAAQLWSLAGIVIAGLILLVIARTVLRSSFFQVQRESAPGQRH